MLKTLSIMGYIAMVGGLLGLVAMRAILSPSPFVISVQVAALLLFVWARVILGRRSFHLAANPTEGGVVTYGPYRYIRHPIYAAFCLFTLASIAGHWSWGAGACGALVIAGAVTRMFCEEFLVAARYPEYEKYAATTWRVIPYVF
jgi:protein-S-isoprenylcysteine O-methyltransferase Ste14